jgi:hypothetical protein
MKRFLMLVAVAVVAGAMYAATAIGSHQAAAPTASQFAALKKQVSKLNKTVTALKKDEKKVKTTATDADSFIAVCLLQAGVAPVSQFGDATSSTYGYSYTPAVGATPGIKTALDLDASANPQGFLQGVAPTCISTGGSSSSAAAHPGSRALRVRAEHTP